MVKKISKSGKKQLHIRVESDINDVLNSISENFTYSKTDIINYLIIDGLLSRGFIKIEDEDIYKKLNLFNMNITESKNQRINDELEKIIQKYEEKEKKLKSEITTKVADLI